MEQGLEPARHIDGVGDVLEGGEWTGVRLAVTRRERGCHAGHRGCRRRVARHADGARRHGTDLAALRLTSVLVEEQAVVNPRASPLRGRILNACEETLQVLRSETSGSGEASPGDP